MVPADLPTQIPPLHKIVALLEMSNSPIEFAMSETLKSPVEFQTPVSLTTMRPTALAPMEVKPGLVRAPELAIYTAPVEPAFKPILGVTHLSHELLLIKRVPKEPALSPRFALPAQVMAEAPFKVVTCVARLPGNPLSKPMLKPLAETVMMPLFNVSVERFPMEPLPRPTVSQLLLSNVALETIRLPPKFVEPPTHISVKLLLVWGPAVPSNTTVPCATLYPGSVPAESWFVPTEL